MAIYRFNGKDLKKAGFKQGKALGEALQAARKMTKFYSEKDIRAKLASLLANPADFSEDEYFAKAAGFLTEKLLKKSAGNSFAPRAAAVPNLRG